LNPILVDGILRVKGRVDKANIDYDARHPIILPGSSHFTKLLVIHHHNLVDHSGMGHTWFFIRQHYWIIKGGATDRRVIGKCILYKKRNSTVGQQLMADLPSGRLQILQIIYLILEDKNRNFCLKIYRFSKLYIETYAIF